MGRIRRGGYVFLTWRGDHGPWRGDHGPYHVHVYRDATLVVKWDLENDVPMKGRASRTVLRLIEELRDEGRL